MTRSLLCIKSAIKPPNLTILLDTIPESLAPMKRAQFEKDSDCLYLNTIKIYFDLSLNIPKSNTALYYKYVKIYSLYSHTYQS